MIGFLWRWLAFMGLIFFVTITAWLPIKLVEIIIEWIEVAL